MSQASTASGILNSVTHGRAWHGGATLEILEHVSAEQASARAIPNAHTIWELVEHLTAWQEYAIGAITGGGTELLEGDADWPPVTEAGEEAWQAAVARFEETADRFRQLIAALSDEEMAENLPGREFKVNVLAHGVAHHACYHSGQIGLLLKALE